MNMPENPRELPGFRKKSFAMFFGGGEIWFEHLDGIYTHEPLVLEKLSADAAVFCRPSMPSLLCFNLDETTVTDDILRAIAEKLTGTEKRFTHVCFIGTDRKTEKHLRRALENHGFALAFTDDFEKAKEWLVSDGVY